MDASVNEEALLYQMLFGAEVPALPNHLGEPDAEEVKKTRSRIERDLEFGSGPGRGLADLYPRSLALWRALPQLPDPLRSFLASAHFCQYREVPFSGAGISLDEAFFEFLREALPAHEAVFREEFYNALFKQLTVQRFPAFEVRSPAIRRVPRGWYALLATQSSITLYAALEQGFVHGPVTPLIADILEGPPQIEHDPERRVIRQRLASMGLV